MKYNISLSLENSNFLVREFPSTQLMDSPLHFPQLIFGHPALVIADKNGISMFVGYVALKKEVMIDLLYILTYILL